MASTLVRKKKQENEDYILKNGLSSGKQAYNPSQVVTITLWRGWLSTATKRFQDEIKVTQTNEGEAASFFEKQHNKNSFSSFCSNDKHPDDFVGQDSYSNNCTTPTSLPVQSHVTLG